jgi:hypothetical protein
VDTTVEETRYGTNSSGETRFGKKSTGKKNRRKINNIRGNNIDVVQTCYKQNCGNQVRNKQ